MKNPKVERYCMEVSVSRQTIGKLTHWHMLSWIKKQKTERCNILNLHYFNSIFKAGWESKLIWQSLVMPYYISISTGLFYLFNSNTTRILANWCTLKLIMGPLSIETLRSGTLLYQHIRKWLVIFMECRFSPYKCLQAVEEFIHNLSSFRFRSWGQRCEEVPISPGSQGHHKFVDQVSHNIRVWNTSLVCFEIDFK